MPTSGTTDWSLTARDIVVAALQENGIIPLGRNPTATEQDACILRLNALLKTLPAGSHNEATGTITIPGGSASGTIDSDVEEIISARVTTTGHVRQLYRWDRTRYYELPNPTQVGEPTVFYESRGLNAVTMYVWPVPATDRDVAITYLRKAQTVTDGSQTVDFPQRFQEALYTILARRCAGLFGVEPPPDLVDRAARLELEMFDADRPRSYFFEPDCA